MNISLKPKEKVSRKASINKIVAHAKYGNHGEVERPKTNDEVELFYRRRGVEPQDLIEKMRNPTHLLPFFENLIGSTWTVTGGKTSIIGREGNFEAEVVGAGQISLNTSQALFETAIKARNRSIEENSYLHIFECITFGLSSIEAFLHVSAKKWSKSNPEDALLDSLESKASLETKILEWVPVMSGGKEFDKTNRQWSDFKMLKKIRDNNAIHSSSIGQGMSYKEMADNLNAFRHGVAHLLGNLHILLGCPVPAVMINAIYYPDIEVLRE